MKHTEQLSLLTDLHERWRQHFDQLRQLDPTHGHHLDDVLASVRQRISTLRAATHVASECGD